METLEILRQMRERLESEGWIKDSLVRSFPVTTYYANQLFPETVTLPPGMCLEGACLVVRGWDVAAVGAAVTADKLEREALPVAKVLAAVIGEQYPGRGYGYFLDDWDVVTDFNDHPETTREDVFAVIDKSIAALEALCPRPK